MVAAALQQQHVVVVVCMCVCGGGGGGGGGADADDDDEFAHLCPVCLDDEPAVHHSLSREKRVSNGRGGWCTTDHQGGTLQWHRTTLVAFPATGRGAKQDHKEAVKWYINAAEQGDVVAQSNLWFRARRRSRC